MPNRILRDGINSSERVNRLTGQAEIFYRRLMSAVDDFGRFTAHVAMLRATLYPLKLESIREADIERWIAECVKAGLVVLYEVSSKRYLEMLDFNQHVRAKRSKFPSRPGAVDHVPCMCAADAVHVRSEAYSEAEAQTPPQPAPRGGSGGLEVSKTRERRPRRPRGTLGEQLAEIERTGT